MVTVNGKVSDMTDRRLFLPAALTSVMLPACSLFFAYPDLPGADAVDDGGGEDLWSDGDGVEMGEGETEGEGEGEREAFCGDGNVDGSEECDDGNGAAGDGCDPDCTFSCKPESQEADCNDGDSCTRDTCNAGTHICDHEQLPEGDPCDDGDPCTFPDVCDASGECAGPAFTPCQDTWIISLNVSQAADSGAAVIETSDGNFVVAGRTSGTTIGGTDMWAAKVNPYGNILWQKAVGGPHDDAAFDVIETSDGGLLLAGSTDSWDSPEPNPMDGKNGWLVKLDRNLDVEWAEMLGGTNDEQINAAVEMTDGRIAFAGCFNCGTSGDVWVGLLEGTSGNLAWEERIGNTRQDDGYGIVETSDHNLAVAGDGVDEMSFTGRQGWIIKISSSDGSLVWKKKLYQDAMFAVLDGIVENSVTHGLMYAGYYGSGSNNLYVFGEISGAGDNLLWQKSMGESGNNRASNIALTSSGGFLVSGLNGNSDIWALKLTTRDAACSEAWQKAIGRSGVSDKHPGSSLVESSGGHILMSGWTESSSSDWDIALVNMSGSGTVAGSCSLVNQVVMNIQTGPLALGDISSNVSVNARTGAPVSNALQIIDTGVGASYECPQ
jgi:cysteine-rich repeat protein